MKEKNTWIFIGIGLLTVIYLFLTLDKSPAVYIDEFWVASIMHESLGVDGIHNTSFRNFTPHYLDVQPFYSFLLGGVIELFGASLFVIRFLSAISILITAWVVHQFINKESDSRYMNILILIIFIMLPIIWRSAHLCRPESIVMCVMLWVIYLNSDVKGKSVIGNLILGFLLVLPVFFYITGILIFPLIAILVVREFFLDPDNRKAIVLNAALRVGGVLIGFVIFFCLVGNPYEVWNYLSQSDISQVNISQSSVLSRAYSYLRYYTLYQFGNVFFYFPAWILIIYFFLKKGIWNRQFLYFIFYVTAVIFLAILSRKSMNYLFYSEVFIALTILSILVTLSLRKKILFAGYFLTIGVFCSLVYTCYYSDFDFKRVYRELDQTIGNDSKVVLARMTYKGFYFNNPKFLALEEFEYLLRIRNFSDAAAYVQSNEIEWAILDEAALRKKEMEGITRYISTNFELIHTFDDPFIGNRIYEDIPYEWNFSLLFERIVYKQPSPVKIYRSKIRT